MTDYRDEIDPREDDGPLARAYWAQEPRSDKGTRHSYIEVYEELFAPYRLAAPRVLEIGVCEGYSLALWLEYFQGGHVTGVDVRVLGEMPADCRIIIGDGTKDAILDELDDEYDIIVDDGSHQVLDQVRTYELLRPLLAPGGMYVIEDIQSQADVTTIQACTAWAFDVIDRRHVKGRYDDMLLVERA